MIREYKGVRYDMSRLPKGWSDYRSENPGIERDTGLCLVWSDGSFRAGGDNFEQNLANVLEGRRILRTLVVGVVGVTEAP